MHDDSKILMGTIQSSYKEGATSYRVDDVTDFPAGTVVRLDDSGGLSKVADDGGFNGLSLGRDLADAERVVVLKAGLRAPVLLTDQNPDNADYSHVTVGQPVWVDDETGLSTAEGETSSVCRAMYVSSPMIGIAEDGSEVPVALIDFPGGL